MWGKQYQIHSTNPENQKRLFRHTFWQFQQLDGTAPPNRWLGDL